jgi:hypothetical protein
MSMSKSLSLTELKAAGMMYTCSHGKVMSLYTCLSLYTNMGSFLILRTPADQVYPMLGVDSGHPQLNLITLIQYNLTAPRVSSFSS